jgi:amidophosphoribosyltransferase
MSTTPLSHTEKQPLWDHCGIVAAYSATNTQFFQTGLRGLSILQTRGYDGAGFWAQDSQGRVYQYKGMGMVNEVFSPEITHLFRETPACVWVYQVRYGTSGDFKSANVQPLIATHLPTGQQFVVAHNGQFSKPVTGSENVKSDTLQFTEELSRMNGPSWDQRLVKILEGKKGAWSLVVGTKDALYLARDPYGFRPLVYGHVWDAQTKEYYWTVASETSSLESMGVRDFLEVLPGTIAKITKKGYQILSQTKNHKTALCIFENIYIHHGSGKAHIPRNTVSKINASPSVDEVRRRSGKILAREAPLTKHDVEMVIGVPGTGIEGGMTYARSLNLPYFQAITDRLSSLLEQRTFMSARVESIYQKVLDHFNLDAQTLKGRRVVLVDDSIVRGNITKGLVYLLKKEHGVTAVHLRVLCPPIDKACHLGVNTRTQEELIAVRHHNSIESIRRELQADSLAYLSASGLKEAITGNSTSNGFCMGCMAGEKYPIDTYGNPPITRPKTRVLKNVHKQGGSLPVPASTN